MTDELINFAARLRFAEIRQIQDNQFNELALELFTLQFKYNASYKTICEARGLRPDAVGHWTQIPFVPTSAFKELEMSCIPLEERIAVFHSSGTTGQKPGRHFHCAKSLEVYETALWRSFEKNVGGSEELKLVVLTPSPELAPHSSLVHMFQTVRRKRGGREPIFFGRIGADGAWAVDFDATLAALDGGLQKPKLILGTAFSFVHLLDFLAEQNLRLELPAQSRVMETGGYKNRSRSMPRAELHSLISEFLGVQPANIICEYGMSELSSQAYQTARAFHFPPWARVQVISPETGREVGDGETGLVRIFDMANVFSVAAIQTEDLAVRRGNGFELIGRAAMAEARGCSLMTA